MSGFEILTSSQGVPIKLWAKGVPVQAEARQQLLNTAQMPFIYPHLAVMPDVKALSVAAQHCLCLRARNSRKHNASDGYAAAIWLVVVRKVCEQDAYRQYRVKHQQPRTWGMVRVLW